MAAQENRQKLIHLHKATSGAPIQSDLYLGEIAVNHSNDKPALYIKNNEGGIIEFLPATAITSISNAHANGLIDALDVSAQTIAYTTTGNVITIYPTITETDGKVLISGDPIEFAKVAKTGKAEDISIEDAGDTFTATTVEGALAELATKMETSTTIDGSGGTFTTGNGIANDNKVLSVKTKTDDYVTVDANGVQLDANQIDTTYATGTTGNLATVNTVKTAIEDLAVTGYAQGVVANDNESIVIAGIKEEDGKITRDTTNDTTLYFDGAYNAETNKIATQETILTAISGLDVTAITGAASQTITSISEEDGKISATYSDISITTSQISDLENKYAPSGVVTTLIGSDTGKSVRTIANEELASQLIASGASASMDTLQEIAAWIQQHPADAAAMNLSIQNLEASAHTHDNMEVLSDITSQQVTNWDGAATNSHTHSNKSLLDSYTQTEANLAAAVASAHNHTNAEILNGIDQEDIDSWNAASTSAHTHANQSVLDGITAEKVAGWDAASADSHTHSNKALLDTYTQTEADLADAVSKRHEHTNMGVISGITAEQVAGWNAASANSHTHENMEVLTGITSAKVSNWDNAVTSATGDTYVEASVTNNTVNVSSTTAATNVFTNAVLGVDDSSSATSANVTVDSATKLLDFSNLSIDCGEY